MIGRLDGNLTLRNESDASSWCFAPDAEIGYLKEHEGRVITIGLSEDDVFVSAWWDDSGNLIPSDTIQETIGNLLTLADVD